MSVDFSIPSGFDGIARLFPLPNVVLFPQVVLPLHIFEPRYRQMTTDALASDRLIAMVLLKPGEDAMSETPALHQMACLGKIIAEQRLENGRFNILLRGLSRARIVKEVTREKLYRSVRVELVEGVPVVSGEEARRLRARLMQRARKWFQAVGLATDQVEKLLESELPLDALGDVLTFTLPLTVEFKQELLEEEQVERRLQKLLVCLETQEPHPSEPSAARKFPPEFSPN
jgi:Lon protease-like protein